MKTLTRPRLVAMIAAVALLGACSGSDTPIGDATADSTSAADDRSWLYSIQSEGPTTFDPDTGRLSMPTDLIHAFTDRPYRDTRLTAPTTFAELWKAVGPDSFAKDPPNAVLTYWEGPDASGAARTVVCEMTGDVDFEPNSGTLSMGLRVLEPAGVELPETMARASLFVDDGPDCHYDSTDENIIEYFNLINYMSDFMIRVSSQPSGSYDISLLCPEQQSADEPPSEFELSMATIDSGLRTSCYSETPLTIARTNEDCDANGECSFIVAASNTSTNTVYSQTEVKLTLKGDLTESPELNPASLPICNASFDPDPSPQGPRLPDR